MHKSGVFFVPLTSPLFAASKLHATAVSCHPCGSVDTSGVQFLRALPLRLLLHVTVTPPEGLQICLLVSAALHKEMF